MLEELHDRVLALVMAISHRVQEETGKTNYFLAGLLFYLMGFSWLIISANYWGQILIFPTDSLLLGISLLWVFICFIFTLLCSQYEKAFHAGEVVSIPLFIIERSKRVRGLYTLLCVIGLPLAWVVSLWSFVFLMEDLPIHFLRGELTGAMLAINFYSIGLYEYFLIVKPLPNTISN